MSGSNSKEKLRQRVIRAAGAAVEARSYVSAIDVFLGMALLSPTHLSDWRQGCVDHLERVIQGNLSKISDVMKIFRDWAHSGKPQAQ